MKIGGSVVSALEKSLFGLILVSFALIGAGCGGGGGGGGADLSGMSLDGISPAHGEVAGGTHCTITGRSFSATGKTTVFFGGASAGNVVVVDTHTIVCDAPAHSSGAVDILVRSGTSGNAVLSEAFTYHDAPSMNGLLPAGGPAAGGTMVTVTGEAFTEVGATQVTFGGVPATDVVVLSATTITCTAPAHGAGAVDVSVTNDFGSGSLPASYTFYEVPSIGGLGCTRNGFTVDLTWTVDDPGAQVDEIVLYRGGAELDRVGPGVESYHFDESAFGYFRYTVGLVDGGSMVDSADVLVFVGKVTWTPPSTAVDGYYLYIAEAVGDPYTVLPYSHPEDFSYDVNDPQVTEVLLEDLYNGGLIGSGTMQGVESYYLAASSYVIATPNYLISVLTPPLTLDFEIAIEAP